MAYLKEAKSKKFEKFSVERNTFKRAVKDDPKDKIELEIGDAKSDDFKPQAKISRWSNEVNFSLRRNRQYNQVRTESVNGGTIKAQASDEEMHFYELDGFEDGGLEVELHLKRKPKTNTFDFSIETKGLDFFYQPELTQEEKEEGAHRPENVVGSYAVYHESKAHNRKGGKHYKTGKAFHIYRPHITDADGNETWGELDITDNTLTVTVPQSFLDKAVYPVVVDPTVGYTSIGGSSVDGKDSAFGFEFTNIAGTITKLTAALKADSAGDYLNEYNVGGSTSNTYYSADQTDTLTTSFQWIDHTSIDLSISDSTTYRPNGIPDYPGPFTDIALLAYDSVGGNGGGLYGGGGEWNDQSTTRSYSIYATYTAFTPPTVTTQAADSITTTSADGNGEITDTGGVDATERGFVYDTSSQTDPGNTSPASSAYSDVENETGTYSASTTIKTYNFDDGTAQGWTFDAASFAVKSNQAYSGTNSIGIESTTSPTASNGASTGAHIEPSELSGGKQIDSFKFYYRETVDSYGGGLRLLDSNDNLVVGVATDNPQWMVEDNGGATQIDAGPSASDYDLWIEVEIVFDWANGEADVTFTDPNNTSDTVTHTATLANNTDVARIELCNYNSGDGGYLSERNWYMWYDDISFSYSDTIPFSLTITGLNGATTYYVRAYAENSEGYSYGDEVSFETQSGFYISGTVTLNGNPVQGATIRCIRQSDNVALAAATTDASGNYTFTDLSQNELYHLAVEYEQAPDKYNALSLWDVSPVEVAA